ncbi:hypothetical protein [Pseudomonas sp.]|uniref:hypothetical protein n=1 Tax=Pseudomonas sp. TaxID=306 RepID=UPI002897CF69|nr:hypothetical protein [Pseudomonas sp.]
MSDRGAHPSFYYLGRECRRNGGGKMANPFTPNTIHGSWLLAGWNDMDMELDHENEKRPAKIKAA